MCKCLKSLLVEQIISHAAMSRGVLVVDESIQCLAPALRGANIKVIVFERETSDKDVNRELLSHRILVTSDPADFVDDAPIYEYGIVSLKKLSILDPAPDYSQNSTAQMISKAISKFRLWTKGAMFLLKLRDDGRHRLRELR